MPNYLFVMSKVGLQGFADISDDGDDINETIDASTSCCG